MNLNQLFEDFILPYLSLQGEDGSFPAGHNGPYLDPEKPTRNTAHILYTLACVYEMKPSNEIKRAAERAINYLFSKEVMPHNASFYCRDKQGKDHCNGLVGQAWVMEALIKAAQVFNRPDCYELAEHVYFLHRWNGKIGIWHRVEVDGGELPFDGTFNHQLWFAAAAAQLDKTPVAKEQALFFLRKVAARVSLYPNGVIFHSSPMGSVFKYSSFGTRRFLGVLKYRLLLKNKMPGLYSKSVGYHGFNLYAYAMLKEIFPKEPIWHSELIKKMMDVTETGEFQEELLKSEFGYFYNVAGIEIAYASDILSVEPVRAQQWLDRQFKQTFEDKMQPLTRGATDKNTAMARLYELARLNKNYEVYTGAK